MIDAWNKGRLHLTILFPTTHMLQMSSASGFGALKTPFPQGMTGALGAKYSLNMRGKRTKIFPKWWAMMVMFIPWLNNKKRPKKQILNMLYASSPKSWSSGDRLNLAGISFAGLLFFFSKNKYMATLLGPRFLKVSNF